MGNRKPANAKDLAYAEALESLTSPNLPPRDLKRRKRMIYLAKRGEIHGAKLIAQRLVSRELLATVKMMIFGENLIARQDLIWTTWDNK